MKVTRRSSKKKPNVHHGLVILIAIFLMGSFFAITYKTPVSEADVLPSAMLSFIPKFDQEETKAPVVPKADQPFIQSKVFGHSVTGRPIEGYEIGTGENIVFLFGSIHGNEMGTTDLLNELVKELKKNPKLVSNQKKLVVIPISNPDGYIDRVDKLNANLVNLNRNFAASDWERIGPEKVFGGETAFSEPESQVIKQVIEEYDPYLMLAFHARGALVTPEADQASIRWARWYAKKTGYRYYDQWDFPGTATKWFMETTGKPSLTIELTKYLQSDWKINRKALLGIIGSSKTTPE